MLGAYSWGWMVIIYLFLGGLGAGAFMMSFLAQNGVLKCSQGFLKAGYLLSAPCIILGCLLLYFDIGIAFSEPLGVFRMYMNFSSVMTWGIWILTAFAIVGLLCFFSALKNRAISGSLAILGAILSLCTAGYTGVLLMASFGIPFYGTPLLPLLFMLSSLSTGLAANSLFGHFILNDPVKNETAKAHSILLAAEIAISAAFIGVAVASSEQAAALSSQMILSGKLALGFWLFWVGCGMVLPLAQKLANICAAPLANAGILVGGLSMRAVIIFAAVPVWILS